MTHASQSFLNCLAFVAVAFAPLSFGQGGFTDRPVRIIVAPEAGGGSDCVARLITQGLSERLGKQLVVENWNEWGEIAKTSGFRNE